MFSYEAELLPSIPSIFVTRRVSTFYKHFTALFMYGTELNMTKHKAPAGQVCYGVLLVKNYGSQLIITDII